MREAVRSPAPSRCASGCAGCARLVGQRASSSLSAASSCSTSRASIALLLRLPLSQPVPRGPDRRAGAEPADAGRDHRRRGRRLRHRRHRLDHHRPRQAAAAPGRRERSAWATTACSNSPINPERVAPLLRRLVTPTRTRARIYDRDGFLWSTAARSIRAATSCASTCRPPPRTSPTIVERTWNQVKRRFGRAERAARRGDQRRQRPQSARGDGRARPARPPAWCASTPMARPSSRWPCRSSASGRCAARCCCPPRAATSTASSPASASPSCASSSWRRA